MSTRGPARRERTPRRFPRPTGALAHRDRARAAGPGGVFAGLAAEGSEPRSARRPGAARGMVAAAMLLSFGCTGATEDRTTTVDPGRPAPAAATQPARPARLRCDEAVDMSAAKGCVTEILGCGSSVRGTTEGGSSVVDNDRYVSAFCFPRTNGHHDGPERGYRLPVPDRTDVVVKLESPCVDLDLVALAWDSDGGCPTEDLLLSECEAATGTGGGEVHLQVFNAREYFLVVDGKNGVVGPYSLSVSCRPLRDPDEG